MATDVTLCECFARDGLQHEPISLDTEAKLALLRVIAATGFRRIEATSYSNPAYVPAFADASAVLAGVARPAGVAYKATCPNERAVERAIIDRAAGHGADELSLLVSATESHSTRNLRASRDEQWQRVERMVDLADARFTLVGVVSVAFGCPFEGPVDPGRVRADAARFRELGVPIIVLGDTIGTATPLDVSRLFGALSTELEDATLVGHFHDTRGAAIANCVAALDVGVTHLDSAIGGVGGHPSQIPYGGGDTGNVCTEDLVDVLEAMGASTGLDLDALERASRLCEATLGRPLASKTRRAARRLGAPSRA